MMSSRDNNSNSWRGSSRVSSATVKKLTMDPGDTDIKYGPPRRKPSTFQEMPEKTRILVAAQSNIQQTTIGNSQFKTLAEERTELVNKLERKSKERDVRRTMMMEKKDTFGHAVINFNLFVEDMERKQARALDQLKKYRRERIDLKRRIKSLRYGITHQERALTIAKRLMVKYAPCQQFMEDVISCGDGSIKEPMQLVDRHFTLTTNIQTLMEKHMHTLEMLEAAKDMSSALQTTMAHNVLDMRNQVVNLKQRLYDARAESLFMLARTDSAHQHEGHHIAESYMVKMVVHNIVHVLHNFRPHTRNKINMCQNELESMTAISEILQDYEQIIQEWQRGHADRRHGRRSRTGSTGDAKKVSFEGGAAVSDSADEREDRFDRSEEVGD